MSLTEDGTPGTIQQYRTRRLHEERYGVGNGRSADRATRRLSAAVHFDTKFCTKIYNEFLAVPFRAVPPSPGLDSAAVLREAAAAIARRRLRNVLALVLMALLLVTAPLFLLGWLLIAVLLRSVSGDKPPYSTAIGSLARSKVTGSQTQMNRWKLAAGILVGFLLLMAINAIIPMLSTLPGLGEAIPGLASVSPDISPVNPNAVMLAVSLYVVFAVDRVVEWWLATRSFRDGRFSVKPLFDAWPGERLARTINDRRLQDQIDGIARAAEHGNIIVYSGADPFVGAGEPLWESCWSMAIPLRPKSAPLDDLGPAQASLPIPEGELAPQHRFTPNEMHHYVRRQFDELRSSLSLAPSDRLRELIQHSVLIAEATELLRHHFDHPIAQTLLPELGTQPKMTMPESFVEEIADNPVEWIRHFTHFRVESWDRDLVVSGFLHLGCDNRMLYVEWNTFALYPIDLRFWTVDLVVNNPWPPLRRAARDLLTCPATIPSRLASLRRAKPPGEDLYMYWPPNYGSRYSIRELAAGRAADNYFQHTDIDRYRKILERHAVASMMKFLDSKGLSTAEFAERAATIINNSGRMLINTGIIRGSAAGGDIRQSTGSGAATPAPRTS